MELAVEFAEYLKKKNLSENTMRAYRYAVDQYMNKYGKVTKANLQKYKMYLLENYKPKTVNLRIRCCKLLSGEPGQGKPCSDLGAGTAEDISGKCHQPGGLHLFQDEA